MKAQTSVCQTQVGMPDNWFDSLISLGNRYLLLQDIRLTPDPKDQHSRGFKKSYYEDMEDMIVFMVSQRDAKVRYLSVNDSGGFFMKPESRIVPHQAKKPRIALGGIQISPQDEIPAAVIALSYPTYDRAKEAASTLSSIHNGTRPFSSGPVFYVGDTAIKVRILEKRDGDPLCVVEAKKEQSHLTWAFYLASRVTAEELHTFKKLIELQRSYTLTVAEGDRPLLDLLNLVKYTIDEGEV